MDDERLKRIETKLDVLTDHAVQAKIDITSIKADVAYHIKRTDLLEVTVLPLVKHDQTTIGIIKAVAYITAFGGAVGALIEGLIMLLKYLGIKG